MPFSLTGLLDFLPRFIIAGIVTYFFISKFNHIDPLRAEKPKFILVHDDEKFRRRPGKKDLKRYEAAVQENTPVTKSWKTGSVVTYGGGYGNGYAAKVTLFRPGSNDFRPNDSLNDIQIVLLSVVLWLLLSIALSPLGTIRTIMPKLTSYVGLMTYFALAVTILFAVAGTVVSRIKLDTKWMLAMLAGAAATTVVLFYLPSMAWINRFSTLGHIVIIYATALVVCVAVYMLAVYVRRRVAFYVSAYSSIAAYGISAILLGLNLILTG